MFFASAAAAWAAALGFVVATSGTGGGGDTGDSAALISGIPESGGAAMGRMSVMVVFRAASMGDAEKTNKQMMGGGVLSGQKEVRDERDEMWLDEGAE